MSRASGLAVERAGGKETGSAALAALWQRHRTPLTRTLAALAFLGVWEWAVDAGMVDPLFLSSPTQVALRIVQVFADGTIYPHLWASGETALWGFVLSCAVGVPIGVLMGRSVLVRDTLEPFIMGQASVPTVALLPLFIIWLGIGTSARHCARLRRRCFRHRRQHRGRRQQHRQAAHRDRPLLHRDRMGRFCGRW